MSGRIRRFASRLRLREWILILYVVSVALPIAVSSVIVIGIARNRLATDYVQSVSEAVDQVIKNIEMRKRIYENQLIRIAVDIEVQERLGRQYKDMLQAWETVRFFDKTIVPYAIVDENIIQLRIFHQNATLVEDRGILWKPSQRMYNGMKELEWYARASSPPERTQWRAIIDGMDHSVTLSLSQPIVDLTGTVLGVGVLDIRIKKVLKDLMENFFKKDGTIYIADESNIVFASTDEGAIGMPLGAFLDASIPVAASATTATARIVGYSVVDARRISSRWTIVSKVPVTVLMTWNAVGYWWTIAVSGMAILLSGALVFLVINRLLRRLLVLGEHMNAVAQGHFITLPSRGRDELGDIETLFDSMSRKLQGLMEDFASAKVQEKEAAFRALQAQVNPHFLYNSLGALRWMAMDAKSEVLCHAIDSLAIFYRLALKNDGGFVKIAEEISHVKAYVEIQQIRFAHRIRVSWDIDEETMDCYTIKLLLQPLVENCYNHANLAKRKEGEILVAVRKAGEGIEFEVRDNGAGMSPDRLAMMHSGEPNHSAGHGYGVRNIRDRLLLCFPDCSSLTVESVEGEGTVVRIAIPEYSVAPLLSLEEAI